MPANRTHKVEFDWGEAALPNRTVTIWTEGPNALAGHVTDALNGYYGGGRVPDKITITPNTDDAPRISAA